MNITVNDAGLDLILGRITRVLDQAQTAIVASKVPLTEVERAAASINAEVLPSVQKILKLYTYVGYGLLALIGVSIVTIPLLLLL